MRAWIIGNGVSLQNTPLYLLDEYGEVSFAMNEIELLYDRTEWRPTHYVRTDANAGPWLGSIAYHVLSGVECYISDTLYKRVANLVPERPETAHPIRVCGAHRDMDIRHPDKPVSWHLPEYCAFGGGVPLAVQIAYTLGYTDLYLLGIDLGFGEPQNHHFDGDYLRWDPLGAAPWLDDTLTYVHKMINRDMSKLGFTVTDATLNGQLGVYPTMTVEQVIDEIVVPERMQDGS